MGERENSICDVMNGRIRNGCEHGEDENAKRGGTCEEPECRNEHNSSSTHDTDTSQKKIKAWQERHGNIVR